MTSSGWTAMVRRRYPSASFFKAPSGWMSAYARRNSREPEMLVATLSPYGEVWIAK